MTRSGTQYSTFALKIGCLTALAVALSPAAFGKTYYIDFATGSDANTGATKTSPWKRHPYMKGWTGSYSHAAGDQFIFKGGVVWTSSVFPIVIPGGGTSSSPDYYGVDQTWFTGSSWSQPVFDAQNTVPSGGSMVVFGANSAYDVLDNIEIRNMRINNSGDALDHCLVQFVYGAGNTTVKNALIHTWSVTSAGRYDQMGGICGLGPMTNIVLDHSTVYNDDQTANKVSACTFNIPTVTYSVVHDCVEGLFGGEVYHDNLVYNIYKSTDGDAHENGIQAAGANCQIYNNVLHSVYNGTALYVVGDTGNNVSGTCNIYNNIVYNSVVANINLDMDQASSGNLKVNVFNNTLHSDGSGAVIRITPRSGKQWSSVTVRNNLYITDASSGEDFPSGTAGTLNRSNNLLMSNSTASTSGFSFGNFFAPTKTSPAVGFGTNLTNLNIAPLKLDRLGVPRPATGAWDAGAYQYSGGGAPIPPLPPTGLSATGQ